jgi:hypothetical protein
VRDERFGEIGRRFFFETALLYPTTTKNFHKISFKAPCHSEINCPFGITVIVEEGRIMILVQTLDSYHNSLHKNNG